jgi:inosine-uridine nucleoside N-ribohydrolase
MKQNSMPSLRLLVLSALLGAGVSSMNLRLSSAEQPVVLKRPVILDTDIGDDIDDTWALGLLLQSPELDVKLVVGDFGKASYRARLIAKFHETAGRAEIPVGVGLEANRTGEGPQAVWVKGYDLKKYPGPVLADGVQAIIDTIMKSARRVTLIGIGPLPNLAAALAREPRIAERARFVGMDGSVRLGYGGSQKPAAEYNVKADIKACQKVFAAPWAITITPLDTCGIVQLDGALYQKMREAKSPIAKAVVENYRLWDTAKNKAAKIKASDTRSSILFDTVAVYLALREQLLKMEDLNLRVTDDGFTVIDPAARKVSVATAWKDLEGFKTLLVNRLTQM